MPLLADRTIAVIGGRGRIGTATVRTLVEAGALVIIGSRDGVAAEALAKDVRGAGSAVGLAIDIASPASVDAFFGLARARWGPVHGVHINAADTSPHLAVRDTDAVTVPLDVVSRSLAVNLRGPFLCVRAAVPHLVENGGGGIVCTSSIAAFRGSPSMPAYAMSKAGLGALVRHVATRWGKQGVRANAVAPGVTVNPEMGERAGPGTEEYRARALTEMRTPRLTTGDDIGAAVRFLLSDEGAQITGQIIHIDGGLVL